MASIRLSLRLAVRNLRGGLRGFGTFLACIALGVAAIVAVGSVARALTESLAREGGTILGGDIALSSVHRELDPGARAWLREHGSVSTVAVLRAMARRSDATAALVEIKAVGFEYPVRGTLALAPAQSPRSALAENNGRYGVAVDATLLARLDVHVGDDLTIGELPVEIRAILVAEPDRLANGVGFGPRLLMSEAALRKTGLIQPGSLVRWIDRIVLFGPAPDVPASDASLDRFVEQLKATFPDAGWEVRTRRNASPSLTKNIERFTQYLTLVGLTALIVGGVGVANAVWLYVERTRTILATLKSFGATGPRVFLIALTQVLLIALFGITVGLVVGGLLPFWIGSLVAKLIPVSLTPAIYGRELAFGVVYGILTTLVFSVMPLGRAHDLSVAALFRDRVEPETRWPRLRYWGISALALFALTGVTIATAADRRVAWYYLGGTFAAFALLRGLAWVLMAVARRLPPVRWMELRLAIGNICRPGALTPSVVLSLGLGLTLLVALTLIDGNIHAELNHALPGRTPSFFFLDIQNAQAAAFDTFLKDHGGNGMTIERVAMMRGRIIKVNGKNADAIKPPENISWVLDGDRGITYSDDLPAGSRLVAGEWWPEGYNGPPVVSLEKEIAQGLGLTLGDSITVNVFGRTITARIANLRSVDWGSFGINFVLVFSPNTFAGAPHTYLATATFANGGSAALETRLVKEVAMAFPAITSVRVKDVLEAVSNILNELAVAIRAASGVAVVASLFVLTGVLAAGHRARIYDAVLLKTLGATRGRLFTAYLLEYMILGTATAGLALGTGVAAAWLIVAKIMKINFVLFWPQILAIAAGSLLVTVILGLGQTFRILGLKPAPYLRAL
jgi:putative ABC transport system permease protein